MRVCLNSLPKITSVVKKKTPNAGRVGVFANQWALATLVAVSLDCCHELKRHGARKVQGGDPQAVRGIR